MRQKTCPYCKQIFEPLKKGETYCGRLCLNAAHRGFYTRATPHREYLYFKNCAVCKKFYVTQTYNKKACSFRCRGKYKNLYHQTSPYKIRYRKNIYAEFKKKIKVLYKKVAPGIIKNLHTFACKHCYNVCSTTYARAKFCSPYCTKAFFEKRNSLRKRFKKNKTSPIDTCATCKNAFVNTGKHYIFCSKPCQTKRLQSALATHKATTYATIVCGFCQSSFAKKLSQRAQAFCSNACAAKHKKSLQPKRQKACALCSEVFTPAKTAEKYCSKACKEIVGKQKTFNNHKKYIEAMAKNPLALLENVTRVKEPNATLFHCKGCGESFYKKKEHIKYCSLLCRKKYIKTRRCPKNC